MQSLDDEIGQALSRGECIDLSGRKGACSAAALARLAGPALPRGLRVRGVRLEGVLDLSDARLAALVLEECIIPDMIDLSGAELGRVSLRGSKIGHIHGPGVTISGSLDFSDVSPAKDDAWIDLSGATIRGGVIGRGAVLHTPPHRPLADVRPWARIFALRLTNAHVHGNVDLNGGFVAEGGITFDNAQIVGSILARGAKLIEGEGDEYHPGDAFNATYANIAGAVWLNFGFQSFGRIVMFTTRIGTNLSIGFQGTHLAHAPTHHTWLPGQLTAQSTLVLDHAMIAGETFLCSCTVEGSVTLKGTQFGGDVQIWGAELNAHPQTRSEYGLRAPGMRVAGSLLLTKDVVAHGKVSLADARIAGRLDLTGLKVVGPTDDGVSIDAPWLTVGGALEPELDVIRQSAEGSANFENLRRSDPAL